MNTSENKGLILIFFAFFCVAVSLAFINTFAVQESFSLFTSNGTVISPKGNQSINSAAFILNGTAVYDWSKLVTNVTFNDTLQSVTDRGSSTTNNITANDFNGVSLYLTEKSKINKYERNSNIEDNVLTFGTIENNIDLLNSEVTGYFGGYNPQGISNIVQTGNLYAGSSAYGINAPRGIFNQISISSNFEMAGEEEAIGIDNQITRGTISSSGQITSKLTATNNYLAVGNTIGSGGSFSYDISASNNQIVGSAIGAGTTGTIKINSNSALVSTNFAGTIYAVYNQLTGKDGWLIYNAGTLGDNFLGGDNIKTFFGTGKDASIYYTGTNLIINPKEVGTGILEVAGVLQTDGYKSADGTTGWTGSCSGTLQVKNGLVVGCT